MHFFFVCFSLLPLALAQTMIKITELCRRKAAVMVIVQHFYTTSPLANLLLLIAFTYLSKIKRLRLPLARPSPSR